MIDEVTDLLTLHNGLRLVHSYSPSSRSGIFGIAVLAGSSTESSREEGLAHFVEHTIFKGTSKRSSWNIINRMEAVGGELNAFTTKEETVVYSIFPSDNEQRAIELIADLSINSVFPEKELEKEREVVIDEINSYLDTPSESIFDQFEEYAFEGTSLAHNILGTEDSVRSLTGADCRRFIQSNYTTSNAVAFYSGPAKADKVARYVEKHFAGMPTGEPKKSINNCISGYSSPLKFNKVINLDIHQSHVLLGGYNGGVYGADRHAVALLTNIIGGPGMNSLLNVELRERQGLVYNVEAGTSMFTPAGLITVYFGCDSDDVKKCIRKYDNVIGKLADKGLTPRQLERAKQQYTGQLNVASENRENTIMSAARATLYRGKPSQLSDIIESIGCISNQDIMNVAANMVSPSSLIYNPKP